MIRNGLVVVGVSLFLFNYSVTVQLIRVVYFINMIFLLRWQRPNELFELGIKRFSLIILLSFLLYDRLSFLSVVNIWVIRLRSFIRLLRCIIVSVIIYKGIVVTFIISLWLLHKLMLLRVYILILLYSLVILVMLIILTANSRI